MRVEAYEECKSLLEDLKKKLIENISQIEQEMNLISSEGEIDDTGDISSIMTDANDHHALLKQQAEELADVNWALSKFDLGTYGICEKTGETIPIERLKVEPQARCVVERS